ncbi:phosphomannomutase [Phyllobacterium sp. YR531]|uniref:phosphomannomutase n=1 Tax=Phyllobacterium sp. YR531 TaxID=1144343 RepID=UPI00026F986E|nr:phosphomannomutase [Phyllobacterium sp. YR531]EJN05340.1 phosphomannomutase [Phyllobacterium sp. YR531]
MTSLKFGTSGLRGLVTELPDAICRAYTVAFLRHMHKAHGIAPGGKLLVGYDLRESSPRIAAACIDAARIFGMEVENSGPLPTPALALRALAQKLPAIMVTGSHIPADRNGLKFYRPDGEIDKTDEVGILDVLDLAGADDSTPDDAGAISAKALTDYEKRCISMLAPNALAGKRIGVYQHSSVGRDLIVRVLGALGAETVAIARSDVFVPVDTEALRPEDVTLAAGAAEKYRLDALVSTDGDADRPLVADETGAFIRGDSLGLLTAHFLNADAVVTPVTSNTAIEISGLFAQVYRTRVGSPYVIEAMSQATKDGYLRVVGFEANGGVLLGSNVELDDGRLFALPTRDAMLPIIAVLGMAARDKVPVSKLLANLPARFTRSGRIEHVGPSKSGPFLQALLDDEQRASFFAQLGTIQANDAIDGVRVVLATGEVVHYRASGNAPELRCYAEAATDARAEQLLSWGLQRAEEQLRKYS